MKAIIKNVWKRSVYKLKFFSEVEEDLDALSDKVYDEVADYFEKLKKEPFAYSQPLFNQGALQLKGYRKVYLANATYRIIIRIDNGVAHIVQIVAVGKREDKQVYIDAFSRIKSL